MAVHLQLRIDGHGVAHELQIAEGHAGLQAVDGDAAVGAQHVVHVQLADALFGLLLECGGAGREVGVLVAEQLVGDLAGQDHADVGVLVDVLAHQVHADARADGGDVPGAQQLDHRRQRLQHVLFGDDDLGVFTADVVGHHPGVFQVDGVDVHADGEGADGVGERLLRDGAHQRGIQPAGQQEADGRVGVQPLLHAVDQQPPQFRAYVLLVPHRELVHVRRIGVADELAVDIVAARRERQDFFAQPYQVLRLAGEGDVPVFQIPIVQRADADRVARGDQLVLLAVVEDQRELRVQRLEHLHAVFPVQRQQDLAVRSASDGEALVDQPLPERPEAVQLAVADHVVFLHPERLHALRGQAHDGQPVKAQVSAGDLHEPAHVRAAGDRAVETRFQFLGGDRLAVNAENGTHKKHLRQWSAVLYGFQDEGRRSVVPPDLLLFPGSVKPWRL